MASYRILIKRSAAKEIEAIADLRDRRRVVTRITALAEEPRPRNAVKLAGRDLYRIRSGRYRVLYSIQDDVLVIHVIRVRPRKDAYRD